MQVANEGGLSLSLCDKLNNIFDENGQYGCPFKDLETQYQQMKYFKTHFRYVVRNNIRSKYKVLL